MRILDEAEQQRYQDVLARSKDIAVAPQGEGRAREGAFNDAEVVLFQRLVHERARRRKEALKLYTPLPWQQPFHSSDAPERSTRGSNRSGKTLCSAVEVARALTNSDPYGKYPKGGRCVIVGKDEKHCGEVLYRKLFKPGAFRVIRDEHTRLWRTFDPELDDARRTERKLAPPLIPGRFYTQRDISWSKKKEEIPKKIQLNSGWECYFFSSLGEAPQGWDVDIVWFDEEIEHPSWYVEMAARLVDRSEYDEKQGRWIGGKFIWSATPQAGTIKLYEISQKAIDERGQAQPKVEEFTATLFDNTYLSNKSKSAFVEKLEGNEDEIRVRVYGEFALLGLRIYGEFAARGVHGCASFPIPDDWCRYIAIDPGRQVCAVLFAAIPPKSYAHPNHVYLYDELYIKRCDAERFAELLSHKIRGTTIYEALIDHHAGRITEMGSGRTIEEQYKQALKKRHVRFEKSMGVSFTWGSDDLEAGILAVKAGLHVRDGVSAKWVVFRDRVPCLIKEMESYANKKDPRLGIPLDKPLKVNDHLVDCLRYLAMHNLRHRKPSPKKLQGGYAFSYLRDKAAKKKAQFGQAGVKCY